MTHPDESKSEPHASASAIAIRDEGPITTTELAIGLQEISRATDALVQRVTDSGGGRDRSEHLLDSARRSHLEESADGRQHNVRCDRCGIKSPGAINQARASEYARQIGWSVNDEFDHCPTCRDDGPKRLAGSEAADGEALPPEPSIRDLIFFSRLDWISDRFESGATSVATIVNARRSGHRAMLTDLAKSFDYDESAFFAKVESLRETDGVGRGGWLQGISVDSAEWNFVKKLFRLLKAEDED